MSFVQAMAEDEISFDPNDIITNIEMVSNDKITTNIEMVSKAIAAGSLVRFCQSFTLESLVGG